MIGFACVVWQTVVGKGGQRTRIWQGAHLLCRAVEVSSGAQNVAPGESGSQIHSSAE